MKPFCIRYLAAALAVIWTTGAVAPDPAQAGMIGLVKRVQDDAYGTPPGAQREEKRPRFPVVEDELLETGKGSAMLVEFLDKTLLNLGSGAHLVVDTFIYDPKSHQGTSVFNLAVGTLRFISGKMNHQGVSIVTPTAILGFRGSDALITVKADGSTTVNVFEGEFTISSSDGSQQTTVSPAQSVSVSTVGAVGAVGPGDSDPPHSPETGSVPGVEHSGGWPHNPGAGVGGGDDGGDDGDHPDEPGQGGGGGGGDPDAGGHGHNDDGHDGGDGDGDGGHGGDGGGDGGGGH